MDKLLRLLGRIERHPSLRNCKKQTDLNILCQNKKLPDDVIRFLAEMAEMLEASTIQHNLAVKQLVPSEIDKLKKSGYLISLMPLENQQRSVAIHTTRGLYQYALI